MKTIKKTIFFQKAICNLSKSHYLCTAIAKIAQLVEHDLAKVGVAGSSPVFRSVNEWRNGVFRFFSL